MKIKIIICLFFIPLILQGQYDEKKYNACIQNGHGPIAAYTTSRLSLSSLTTEKSSHQKLKKLIIQRDDDAAVEYFKNNNPYQLATICFDDELLLCWAVKYDLPNLVEKIVKTGRPNACYQDGRTVLEAAYTSGFFETTKYLLQYASTDSNKAEHKFDNLLKDAVYLQCLLDNLPIQLSVSTGISPDFIVSPFINAIKTKDEKAALDLLSRDPSIVNYPMPDGDRAYLWFPLEIAVHYCMPNVVKKLLEAKADCNFVDSNGDNVLENAINEGYLPIIKTLIEHGVTIPKEKEEETRNYLENHIDVIVKIMEHATRLSCVNKRRAEIRDTIKQQAQQQSEQETIYFV